MPTIPYGSGGSMGKYTPTFVSLDDRIRETNGFRRAYDYYGFCSDDVALTTYNPTHKGGQWIQESLWRHGMDTCLKRTDEDADGRWLPVEKGEEGLLVYTSWARDGTIWIRYAPGDVATKLLDEGECACGIHSPVITNVHRHNAQEQQELFVNGCAAG